MANLGTWYLLYDFFGESQLLKLSISWNKGEMSVFAAEKMGPKAHWVYRSDARELKKHGELVSVIVGRDTPWKIIDNYRLEPKNPPIEQEKSCSIHLHVWVPC